MPATSSTSSDVKFGTSQNPALTWAANTLIPTLVAGRFPRARLVALSTGNVYPLVPVAGGGATETHPLTPLGEYANAAVARERLFEFHAQRHRAPMVLIRLNYAVELRYGVLRDLAAESLDGRASGPDQRLLQLHLARRRQRRASCGRSALAAIRRSH